MKKAIILDLDNTIYPVSSIGEDLFKPVFELIGDSGYRENLDEIKKKMMRTPFQKVANEYGFSDDVVRNGAEILKDLAYDKEMQPFDDYQILRALPCKKFLVTMGFTKMQQAKVDKLNLADDFEGIYIIDPEHSSKSKKDVFVEIMENNSFSPDDLLVIGDDPDSEVRGAQELGIDAVLYDRINVNPNYGHGPRITNYGVLHQYLA